MTKTSPAELHDLINRISRLGAAEHWVGDLNPAQIAALSYLARANQYSRAPSQVAEYLSAMRGTVSATLKALLRKGLIEEKKSETDRRRTSFSITFEGMDALKFNTSIDAALSRMDPEEIAGLELGLKGLVRNVLRSRGDRSFGICATCQHHQATDGQAHTARSAYCALLDVPLAPLETAQICCEHQFAA